MTDAVHCLVCRKRITKPEPDMVHMHSGTGKVYAEGHDGAITGDDPKYDQGWFEVGSDCLRKVKKAGDAGFAWWPGGI